MHQPSSIAPRSVLADRILLYTENGDAALTVVRGLGLEPLTSLVRRSTLEDVFLRLTGRRLVSLLSAESEAFDLMVVDSAPIMGLADAPLLSHATTATLLVVAAGQSRANTPARANRSRAFRRSLWRHCCRTSFSRTGGSC